MAGMSDYLESAVLAHTLGVVPYAAPSAVYVALFTVAPTDAGGGTEVAGGSYGRQAATFAVSGDDPTTAVNSAQVNFPQATGTWGVVVAAGIYDATTDGNLLYWADLVSPKEVVPGSDFYFPAGDLEITLD